MKSMRDRGITKEGKDKNFDNHLYHQAVEIEPVVSSLVQAYNRNIIIERPEEDFGKADLIIKNKENVIIGYIEVQRVQDGFDPWGDYKYHDIYYYERRIKKKYDKPVICFYYQPTTKDYMFCPREIILKNMKMQERTRRQATGCWEQNAKIAISFFKVNKDINRIGEWFLRGINVNRREDSQVSENQ